MNLLNALSLAFFVTGFLLTYWLFIVPLLRARPGFSEFYARTDSFWLAVWGKLNTIKTKLLAVLLAAGSFMVLVYDFILPFVTGVDWSPITEDVPLWFWPVLTLATNLLFYWLRRVTAKAQKEVVEAVANGMPVEEAEAMVPGEHTMSEFDHDDED